MGIIKATVNAVGGALADQWLEVIEPDHMGDQTMLTSGVTARKNDRRNQNAQAQAAAVSNGSIIHVYPNQFMMLVDGGKVIDYTAEEGYYTVHNSSMPSLFNGQLDAAIADTFDRVRFGGVNPTAQRVYYINLQELKGIRFGTRNPINYFDSFYNAELFLRTHGTYSIRVTDPIKFYMEAVPRSCTRVEVEDINEQYLSEFLEALGAAINRFSADGVRVSFVPSKGRELSRYMADILDEEWKKFRGIEVQSVGIASISYDEQSQKLINMRNEGAMLGDAAVREGYVRGAVARGVEAAGNNSAGSMTGFMGMGMGAQLGGALFGAPSSQPQVSQPPQPDAPGWRCICGVMNNGKFCAECGSARPSENEWVCVCKAHNTGRFCSECGQPRVIGPVKCARCGHVVKGAMPKFCPECGGPITGANE